VEVVAVEEVVVVAVEEVVVVAVAVEEGIGGIPLCRPRLSRLPHRPR
jgi:hypothetical protein